MLYGLDVKTKKKTGAHPKAKAICPVCQAELIPKCGTERIWHFAHAPSKGVLCDGQISEDNEWSLILKSIVGKKSEVVIEKEFEIDGKKITKKILVDFQIRNNYYVLVSNLDKKTVGKLKKYNLIPILDFRKKVFKDKKYSKKEKLFYGKLLRASSYLKDLKTPFYIDYGTGIYEVVEVRYGNILFFRLYTYGGFFRKITNVFLNSEQYKKLIDLEYDYEIEKSDYEGYYSINLYYGSTKIKFEFEYDSFYRNDGMNKTKEEAKEIIKEFLAKTFYLIDYLKYKGVLLNEVKVIEENFVASYELVVNHVSKKNYYQAEKNLKKWNFIIKSVKFDTFKKEPKCKMKGGVVSVWTW